MARTGRGANLPAAQPKGQKCMSLKLRSPYTPIDNKTSHVVLQKKKILATRDVLPADVMGMVAKEVMRTWQRRKNASRMSRRSRS